MENKIVEVKDFEKGKTYQGIYLLKNHSIRLTKSGSKYLDITFGDSSGNVSGKIWELPEDFDDSFLVDGYYIYLTFVAEEYNNNIQAKVISYSKVDNVSEEDKNRLVAHSPEEPMKMFMELANTANNFENEDLKKVVLTILQRNKDILLQLPAAKSMHHDVMGGLLWHTCEVLRTAKALSELYPCHRELLYAGAILHDIAKTVEFSTSPLGLVDDYTQDGKLLGHLCLGYRYISDICDELKIDPTIRSLLGHMILSHHGKPEFGSPTKPAFVEAMLLHESDVISAKAYEFNEAIKQVEPNCFSDRIFGLENVEVYNFDVPSLKKW